jgi:hypothetical protein
MEPIFLQLSEMRPSVTVQKWTGDLEAKRNQNGGQIFRWGGGG